MVLITSNYILPFILLNLLPEIKQVLRIFLSHLHTKKNSPYFSPSVVTGIKFQQVVLPVSLGSGTDQSEVAFYLTIKTATYICVYKRFTY